MILYFMRVFNTISLLRVTKSLKTSFIHDFLFMSIFLSRVSYVCVLFFCKYLRPIYYCSCFLWIYIYVTLFIFWYPINRMVKLYLHFRFCTVVGQGFFIYLHSYLAITKLALLETTWEFRHLVLNTCGYRLYHHHMTNDVLKMSSFFKTWPQFWIPLHQIVLSAYSSVSSISSLSWFEF